MIERDDEIEAAANQIERAFQAVSGMEKKRRLAGFVAELYGTPCEKVDPDPAEIRRKFVAEVDRLKEKLEGAIGEMGFLRDGDLAQLDQDFTVGELRDIHQVLLRWTAAECAVLDAAAREEVHA